MFISWSVTIESLLTTPVGGTGGIGESTAREVFKQTTRPKAYIIGTLVELVPGNADSVHKVLTLL